MPKKFIETEKAIEREIKSGKIHKYYYKHGKRYESNPYALARHATGYYGSTHDIGMIHPIKYPKNPHMDYCKFCHKRTPHIKVMNQKLCKICGRQEPFSI